MFYVYRLQSRPHPSFAYTGYSTDLKRRLSEHNRGQVKSTSPHAPFDLIFYAAFEKPSTARSFESYLKTGSGKAFANKRLFPASEK